MPITREQLANRLRLAREVCQIKQNDVACQLVISESMIAQIESGQCAISSLELSRFAYLYGRDIAEFFSEEFEQSNSIISLLAHYVQAENNTEALAMLRQSIVLYRELKKLCRLLGLDEMPVANIADVIESERERYYNDLRYHILLLSLNAFRAEKITRAKFEEILELAMTSAKKFRDLMIGHRERKTPA